VEHGGASDLANLPPLCSQHHHKVHDAGWRLTLAQDRQLTIDFSDGTRQTTGPPRRGASHGRPPPQRAEPIEPTELTSPAYASDALQPRLL
jgi:hypothetical protein